MGRKMGRWLVNNIPSKSGKLLEVRGVSGNSVDRDRHLGFREIVEGPGNKFEVVEVVGNWDDGTAQKATADAVAVHKHFDGIYTQGGSTGVVRALIDTKHPFIPVSGEGENGFRKLCAQHAKEGLVCASAGQTPALVAIAMKAGLSALQGQKLPQLVSVPIPYVEHPNFKDGDNYFSSLSDNFFVANSFPACEVNFSATDIMAKTEENN
jgi:ribose transport system substrate-binding protein